MVTPLEPDDPRALGEFTLSGRLGEGGQGVVFLGRSPRGEPVAVKVLKSGLDASVQERLVRELDAMRGVAPFCTARVLTVVVDGRMPYVVSEFIDGPSLQQRVDSGGPLRGGELERLAVGTATALTAIHGAGIVHRDFKPANVLLGPDGPRVVDFGIARHGASDTITAGPVGTPAYLAPEQIAGAPATPASDVFAWGATIVFAATGREAFGADSVPAVMHRILTAEPDASALLPPLRSVVERCLAKDPARRPSSRDLLLELVGSAADPLQAGAAAATTRPEGVRRGGTTAILPVPGPGGTFPSGDETTGAGGHRRASRAGIVAGVVAVVAAVSVTAALLAPRLLSGAGTSTPAATTPAATTPAATTTVSRAAGSSAPPTPGEDATAYGTEQDDTVTTEEAVEDAADDTAEDAGPTPTAAAVPSTTPGGTVPAAFAGTWGGHLEPDQLVGTSETDVQVVLEQGGRAGSWKDTNSSCRGSLTLTRSSSTALVFRLDTCAPGTITLIRTGEGLAYRWAGDEGEVTYQGLLVKD
ncbi:serine/threonine protein kinase [Microbispora sp. SCL1-1]|uniref:serine/threonine-protein kinase n=1 Tax=unclassified Microbispora TaxID=2614687 RepID=UPI00115703C4|nr:MULTISPECIES: serine/threonine-protein kinase [unclassified Microbispora]NJP26887.1 serine/threonine protein kinase [Microbispora sp. CL1-1]TQS11806.1 serine/threonine protein kinase [Microbispora sp. SCL1-1]